LILWNWNFLLKIPSLLGLHSTWIQWIQQCISTTSFSILLDRAPFGKFNPSRSLRQEDPLSPFLFIFGVGNSFQVAFERRVLKVFERYQNVSIMSFYLASFVYGRCNDIFWCQCCLLMRYLIISNKRSGLTFVYQQRKNWDFH
jgi:hypothetical protein